MHRFSNNTKETLAKLEGIGSAWKANNPAEFAKSVAEMVEKEKGNEAFGKRLSSSLFGAFIAQVQSNAKCDMNEIKLAVRSINENKSLSLLIGAVQEMDEKVISDYDASIEKGKAAVGMAEKSADPFGKVVLTFSLFAIYSAYSNLYAATMDDDKGIATLNDAASFAHEHANAKTVPMREIRSVPPYENAYVNFNKVIAPIKERAYACLSEVKADREMDEARGWLASFENAFVKHSARKPAAEISHDFDSAVELARAVGDTATPDDGAGYYAA